MNNLLYTAGLQLKTGFLYCIMEKVNLAEKFSQFTEHWSPQIAGELNGQHVKLVKFKGPFTWHHHEHEDELFYVVKGSFEMEFRDHIKTISEGEFIIVPKGVEHRPNAKEEVQVLLFEPATTLNTGNVENEFTKKDLGKI
jgi:mannose-6-phosphate isomerase-like protein (cupin superfamily)